MGNCNHPSSQPPSKEPEVSERKRRLSQEKNLHNVIEGMQIHVIPTRELDAHYERSSNSNEVSASMRVALGECTDEQLVAELARRGLDLHDSITEEFVKKTYNFGSLLGRGASGDVIEVTHIESRKVHALKQVKRNSNMNDAESMSTEIEILKRLSYRHLVCMRELYETPQTLWIILDLVMVFATTYFFRNKCPY